jgi:hypothetical protein
MSAFITVSKNKDDATGAKRLIAVRQSRLIHGINEVTLRYGSHPNYLKVVRQAFRLYKSGVHTGALE